MTLFSSCSPDPTSYSVTLSYGKGISDQTLTVEPGGTISEPESVSKDGEAIRYWVNSDGSIFDFSIPITSDITLNAHWEKYYTITFVYEEGGEVETQKVWEKERATAPADRKTETKRISGWKKADDTSFNFSDPITENLTLKAKWENSFSVTFDLGEGLSNKTIYLYEDEVLYEPETPIKEGYSFKGWFSDSSLTIPYNFGSAISSSTTIYSKWAKIYTITLNFYGLEREKSITIEADAPLTGEQFQLPSEFGTEKFIWVDSDGKEITKVEKDVTIYPKWVNADYIEYKTSIKHTFLVYKETGLKAWADATNNNSMISCILLDDITLSTPDANNNNWTPIGISQGYMGIFFGNGHTISNLTFNNDDNGEYIGFMAIIDAKAVIRDLTLSDIKINISDSNKKLSIGPLVAITTQDTNILNCKVNGSINVTKTGGETILGGLVASSAGTVNGCETDVTIDFKNNGSTYLRLGGLVGENTKNIIASRSNTVMTIEDGNHKNHWSGGLTGYNLGTILGSISTGTITVSGYSANARYIGGLIGQCYDSSIITSCYTTVEAVNGFTR